MTLWYLMRATGLVAFVLLTATVALGILGALRWQRERWTRTVTALIHRNASLLSVVFVAIHVVTAVSDRYVSIPISAVFVPGTSVYRPLWTAMGALAFDLIAALVITSLLRVLLGRRTWRAVHWLAYAAWPVALTHAIGTGTDTGQLWTTAIYIVSGIVVLAAIAFRLASGRRSAGALDGDRLGPVTAPLDARPTPLPTAVATNRDLSRSAP